jgi:hypothetical protein
MDEKLKYVFRHYFYLTNWNERFAHKNLMLRAKGWGDDANAGSLSNDPKVVILEEGGLDPFVIRTAQRIIADHPEKVFFNHCPACNALARTPRARQCRFCGHDWHYNGDSQ